MAAAQRLDGEASLRRVRAQWRSTQLLGAAARLMDRQGYAAVSMQALAEEAGVSVGLIYRYFGGKDDLLLAIIVAVLDALAEQVGEAMAKAADDPIEQLAAGFRSYCEVIDVHRHAALLAYRESGTLTAAGQARIKSLEAATSEPLAAALQAGIHQNLVTDGVDTDLLACDLLLAAHGWALKHWYFEPAIDLDTYVDRQTALLLSGVVAPRHRRRYAHLFDPSTRATGRAGRPVSGSDPRPPSRKENLT